VQPYLSPHFPWTAESAVKDRFGSIPKLCRAASTLGKTEVPTATTSSAAAAAAIDLKELELVDQWVVAIHRGLNETQLRVYKVSATRHSCECAVVVVGVLQARGGGGG
jgi:hypothetical protein